MNNIVDINDYTNRLTDALKSKFGYRLLYVGLQGSFVKRLSSDAVHKKKHKRGYDASEEGYHGR